jgi:hypothetical protein
MPAPCGLGNVVLAPSPARRATRPAFGPVCPNLGLLRCRRGHANRIGAPLSRVRAASPPAFHPSHTARDPPKAARKAPSSGVGPVCFACKAPHLARKPPSLAPATREPLRATPWACAQGTAGQWRGNLLRAQGVLPCGRNVPALARKPWASRASRNGPTPGLGAPTLQFRRLRATRFTLRARRPGLRRRVKTRPARRATCARRA